MQADPSQFHPYNVTDTCAVWNILSSLTLYSAARAAQCHFICTAYVLYECLVKPRKGISDADAALMKRLQHERAIGQFREFHLTLDELEDVTILERRQNLGKGELSSMAFAKRHRQAFCTDDQKGRRLAEVLCGHKMVQTTPHLLGWLFYSGQLLDGDLDRITGEHKSMERPLAIHFQVMYRRALECRARDTS